MGAEEIRKILKAVGISSGIILVLMIIIGGSWVYRNYLEGVKLKLEIKQLEQETAK